MCIAWSLTQELTISGLNTCCMTERGPASDQVETGSPGPTGSSSCPKLSKNTLRSHSTKDAINNAYKKLVQHSLSQDIKIPSLYHGLIRRVV